eukprot:TRINITY_DN6590_c0_g1_i1.p1 TRINITY_DN6590_c0_g1~~TRINITY_DN6590_c0_g1_i1.p1  ORF type:complete len:218 (-),score=42.27 TRINITY_DN6590_c0_g1_i1:60-713(-)
MANHSETPNAIWNFEDGVFKLVALKPIAVEEEVVICYHEKMDNRRTYMQYGFVSIGGNRNDRIPGMDKVKEQGEYFLSRPRLWQYLSSRGMQPDDPEALMPAMVAAVRSLPLQESPNRGLTEEADAADALRSAIEDFAASEFTPFVVNGGRHSTGGGADGERPRERHHPERPHLRCGAEGPLPDGGGSPGGVRPVAAAGHRRAGTPAGFGPLRTARR